MEIVGKTVVLNREDLKQEETLDYVNVRVDKDLALSLISDPNRIFDIIQADDKRPDIAVRIVDNETVTVMFVIGLNMPGNHEWLNSKAIEREESYYIIRLFYEYFEKVDERFGIVLGGLDEVLPPDCSDWNERAIHLTNMVIENQRFNSDLEAAVIAMITGAQLMGHKLGMMSSPPAPKEKT